MIGDIAILVNLVIHAWFILRVDLQFRLIPNRLLVSLILFHIGLVAITHSETVGDYLVRGGIVGLVIYVPYSILAILSRGNFGMGDAKAISVTSFVVCFFSTDLVAKHIVSTHIIGLGIGLLMLILRKKETIPYAIPIFASSIGVSLMAII